MKNIIKKVSRRIQEIIKNVLTDLGYEVKNIKGTTDLKNNIIGFIFLAIYLSLSILNVILEGGNLNKISDSSLIVVGINISYLVYIFITSMKKQEYEPKGEIYWLVATRFVLIVTFILCLMFGLSKRYGYMFIAFGIVPVVITFFNEIFVLIKRGYECNY